MPAITVHKQHTYTGHKDCIYGLGEGFVPNTFVTGGADGWVVEWNYQTPGDGQLLVQVNAPVYSFAVLKEDQKMLCGTRAGNLHVVDMFERKEVRNIEAHTAGIFDIAHLPQTKKVITAGGDGRVLVWDDTGFTLITELKFSEKSARVIALHPTQPQVAVGYSDNFIRVFSTTDYKLLYEIEAHTNSVFALAYSPDEKYLLSGGRDAVLKIWDAQNGYAAAQTINAHLYHINSIKYNPTGTLFATVSMDKTIKLWDAKTFDLLKVIDKPKNDGHTTSVNKVLWLSDKTLVTASDDKTAMLWVIS
jgi:WD40 repeat protein